jgi:hypothetical protein
MWKAATALSLDLIRPVSLSVSGLGKIKPMGEVDDVHDKFPPFTSMD